MSTSSLSTPWSTPGAACGCCAGRGEATPVRLLNRPGLDAVAYRVGTHSRFLDSLSAALSTSDRPELAALTSRDSDDFSIALLDAWATVADILTFYQERLANEAYLRTARERLSVEELARLIGYRLAPGVAADAFLAFTLEGAPGAPARANARTPIDIGTRVQSTPGPGETAQTFETTEAIEGRVAWNAIEPRLTRPHALPASTTTLYLDGIATELGKGNGVFYTDDDGASRFAVTTEVEADAAADHTKVSLRAVGVPPPGRSASTSAFYVPPPEIVQKAGPLLGTTLTGARLEAEAKRRDFEVEALFDYLAAHPSAAEKVRVYRTRAAVFGHNAPAWEALPQALRGVEPVYTTKDDGTVIISELKAGPFQGRRSTWTGLTLQGYLNQESESKKYVYLDRVYPDVVVGDFAVLRDGETWASFFIREVTEVSHADFTLSTKVTRLTLRDSANLTPFSILTTTVYLAGEALDLAPVPITDAFTPDAGGWLELDGWVPGLAVGRRLAVRGKELGGGDQEVAEITTLDGVEHILTRGGRTRIQAALQRIYQRDTVTLNANVVAATHGETVREVLGSGDATKSYQRFTLAQPPLTHVSAATLSGRLTTLEVRVEDVLWKEVDTLYGRGPEERVYVTEMDDDGKTSVVFGNGVTGARLPTGRDNVRARYRKGIGLEGRVQADRLDLLMSRPLGLKEVTNPQAATGGQDAESRDEARRNAPLQVLTLGRAVSLQDYEDYARTYAGIAKARATWHWDGRRRGVFLTLAGPNGIAVEDGGTVQDGLRKALRRYGDPRVPLTLASYAPAFFLVEGRLLVDARHLPEKVLQAARAALREHFSFSHRDFGRPVALSEVMAVLQGVQGVAAVDIDRLYREDETPDRRALLDAREPLPGHRGNGNAPQGAELLLLHPAPLDGLTAVLTEGTAEGTTEGTAQGGTA